MKDYSLLLPDRKPQKPFDPIGTLFRHWMIIALFGTLVFIIAVPCAFFISKPYYSVEGKMLVSPAVHTFIARNEETPIIGYYNAYVRTHVNRIKEKKIIEKALEDLEPELKSIFVPEKISTKIAAARLLKKRLQIFHMTGTHLITLKMDGDNPRGLAEFINSILNGYMKKIQDEIETKDYRRLMYLQDEKDKIEEEIISQTRLFQEIAKKTGTFSFNSADNIYNTQFESLQEEYVKAYSNRVEKENTLSTYIKLRDTISTIPVDPLVEELLSQNKSIDQINTYTYEELQRLYSLLDGYAYDHPKRPLIEERIKKLEENLKNMENAERVKVKYILSEKRNYELEEKIIVARSEYDAAKEAEQDILKKRDIILSMRAEISKKILSGQQIKEHLEHLRILLNRIDERISELQLEAKAPGRLQIESFARLPDLPSGSNLKKILILFFILSYGGIVMLCVLYDIFDNRVRDRGQIISGLGSEPTWPVSNYNITGSGLVPFSNVTMDDSSNVVAKAIQSLAIRIDRERKENNAQCALFTGVDRCSGTTEILLNTAYAFTKLCKKVLVIDAQFEHPAIESITQTPSSKSGLIDFLLNKVDISDCIVHDYERCLDYILPGHRASPEELASLDLSVLPQMIEELKEQYSLIFIDSTPILRSDITEFLALQSDITSLIIQGDKSLYGNLYMAGDILFRLKVPAIAAVLNWGGPRNLTRTQKEICKILWPIEKFIARLMGRKLKYVKYYIE